MFNKVIRFNMFVIIFIFIWTMVCCGHGQKKKTQHPSRLVPRLGLVFVFFFVVVFVPFVVVVVVVVVGLFIVVVAVVLVVFVFVCVVSVQLPLE